MDFTVKAAQASTEYTNNNTVVENNNNKKATATQNASPSQQQAVAQAAKEPVSKVQASKPMDSNDTANKEQAVDESEVAKAVAEANRNLMFSERSFQYKVDESTNRVIITVIDSETQEVIKEIPPEKQVDAVKRMWKLAGLIVDKKI